MPSNLIFSDYKDIQDFYKKTGMNREQAFDFLKRQLEGLTNEALP